MRSALILCLLGSGCGARLSAGVDSTASVSGPLANLAPIARRTALTGAAADAPADGRNYSLGLGFGDKAMTFGLRVQGNNLSGSTLGEEGPQYVSAAAALEFRYAFIRTHGFGLGGTLAPGRTLLIDATNGVHNWGTGVRYGGSLSFARHGLGVYADLYQEQLVFGEGPADGNSKRSGVTVGVSFQP